jgi:hypothetical protein
METLGMPVGDSFIRIVDSGGDSKDHGLLPVFVALPKLGAAEGGAAEFQRPPTRYIVCMDGDRSFGRQGTKEAVHGHWVRMLWHSLPGSMQTEAARTELEQMVIVRSWADGNDFERVHFSDAEIATALETIRHGATDPSHGGLELELRANRDRRENLKVVWKDWPDPPNKPDLIETLWPALEARIEACGGERECLTRIPIVALLLDAYDLAMSTPRRNVLFRIGDPD